MGSMTKRNLLTNSGVVLTTQIWSLFLAFFTTPYIIRNLGTEAFGILSIIMVLIGSLSFLDLGFGWALTKYISEFWAKDDRDAIRKSFSVALFVSLSLGLFASALVILSADWLAKHAFNIPDIWLIESINAIRISAVVFFFTSLVGVYSSLFRGLQRFDLSNLTQSVFYSLYTLGSVALLFFNKGLIEIVWLNLMLSGLSLVVHILLANRYLPGGVSWIPRFHKSYFKLIWSFGFFSMISRLGGITILYVDKFFVSYFLPISMLPYYIVSFNLSQKLNFMGSNIALVLMPFASEKKSLNQMIAYKRVYFRVTKMLWLLTLAPTLVFAVFADKILGLWIGLDFADHGATPLIFLSIGFFLISVASLDAVSIEGVGKPRITALFHSIVSILCLIFLPFITKYYGIVGTSVVICLAFLSLSFLNIIYFNIYVLKSPLRNYITLICYPCFKVIVLTVPFLLLIKVLANDLPTLILICFVSVLLILFIGASFLFDKEDRSLIKNLVLGYLGKINKTFQTQLFKI